MKKAWQQGLVALMIIMLPNVVAQASGVEPSGGDKGLSVALESAVTRNPSVKNKLAELQSAGFKVEEVKAGWLPSFSLQAQGMNTSENDGTFVVQQTLWSFGKIEKNMSLAEGQIEVAKMSLLQVRRQLMEDTAATYVDIWGARKRLAIAAHNVAEHDRLYQMILRRSEGGIASAADVRLALSRLLQAQAQQEQLQGVVDKGYADLASLTQNKIEVDETVDAAMMQGLSPQDILEKAKKNEAKVQGQRAALLVARAQVDVQKAELLPTLSLRYEHDIATKIADSNIYSPNRLGISLQGNVDGLGIVGKKRIAGQEAMVLAAQGSVDSAVNDVERRVQGLLTDRDTQQRLSVSLDKSAVEMEDALNSFLRQYDAGRKSWIDVLNSQRELCDTLLQLEQARTSCLEASLRLAAVSGQLDYLVGVKL